MKPDSQNYYERLGIPETSTEKDIEKAFYRAIRVYQPERNPEEYKLIREAYDTLNSKQSRNEYDNRSQHGPEIQRIEAQIEEARENEDIDEQIRLYKRLVTLLPLNATIRNRLGLAFAINNQESEALAQYGKAHQLDQRNPLYLLNMAYSYKEQEKFDEAEKYYLQAWDLDKNDFEPPRDLANMYFYDMDEKQKAYSTLKQAISNDGVVDFQDFFCLFDLVKLYCLDNNESELRENLALIVKISNKSDEKDYSASHLQQFAILLASSGLMDLSVEFIETSYQLHKTEEIKFSRDFITQISQVSKNSKYSKPFKILVRQIGQIYYDGLGSEQKDEFYEALSDVMNCEPNNSIIKSDINLMKVYQPVIYQTNEKFFDTLLGFHAQKYLNECPFCSDMVSVDLYDYSSYTCPHCRKSIIYTSSGYSKGLNGSYTPSQPSGTGSSESSKSSENYYWVYCLIAIVVFVAISQCSF